MEVALSTRLFLSVAGTFRLGYARGFGPLGTNVVYFVMGP
jgi:hypothetical protein